MGQRRDWIQRMSEQINLALEPLPGIPLVELSGDQRVLIENHKGIVHYGAEKICVKVNFGQVVICGSCLELAQMTEERLVICGRIDSVMLVRRCAG